MRTAIPLTVLATALACSLATTPANARARVFVASYGSDGNPCTFLSPCRNFQQAVNVVDAGGEVTAIDSAGFGPINITKAVTITSPDGVEAGIVPVSGGNAITIGAGSTDAVELHGLTVDGSGAGNNGIVFASGGSLIVENCVVRNMASIGLDFLSTATTTQTLAVSNSYFNKNGVAGIKITTESSGFITAAIDRTGFDGNGNGLLADGEFGTGGLVVAVTDSVASNNGQSGFAVQSAANHSSSSLSVKHSLAEGNVDSGVRTGPNATLWLAQSTLIGNGSCCDNMNGGTINTYLDNYLDGNFDPPEGGLTSANKG
jgi:hypothetical protein